MLVLTRNQKQSITLDNSIVITILSVQGGRVRLGIEAPDKILVQRTEKIVAPDGSKNS